MNRKLCFGALVLASLGTSAFADDITVEPHPFVSTRTQAQVQAELAQYKLAGVNPWSISYNPVRYFRSEKTRAQVEQEYVASRDEVSARTGEDSGSARLAQRQGPDVSSQFAGQPIRRQ